MSDLEALEFEATLGAEDYAEAAMAILAVNRKRPRIPLWRSILVWVLIFVITMLLTGWWPNRETVTLSDFLGAAVHVVTSSQVLVPLGIILFFAAAVVIYNRNKRAIYLKTYRRILAGRTVAALRYRLDADGLHFAREGMEGRIAWSAFQGWRERPNQHLLRIGAMEVMALPKPSLTPSQQQVLARWLSAHVARVEAF